MNQDKIGKFIAQRRKARGFLQKDIAERLGVSEKTISKWECGNGLPEVVFMEPLCAILKITVNELLAGESIPILELLNTIDVSRLELVRQLEFEQLKMRLYKLYEIEIESMEPTENGAGGLTYFVTVGNRKYVVKYPSDNEMNHPDVEIMRSYVFMAPEVRDGEINIDALLDYINAYLRYGSLKPYDVENAGRFFFYFLAVCNFYGQYYASLSRNRTVYLEQANMAAGLLSWFEKHIEELDQRLGELARKIEYQHKLAVYYDEEGRLTQYPGKRPLRELALLKIADCFEPDRRYTEKEVNEIIRENISFSDVELIRREMFQSKLLGRLRDGSQYWREI